MNAQAVEGFFELNELRLSNERSGKKEQKL